MLRAHVFAWLVLNASLFPCVVACSQHVTEVPNDTGGHAAAGGDAGGSGGNGSSGGGAGIGGGQPFCAPCVASADCAGAHCVGGINPRCGKPCTMAADCSVGSATSTCQPLGVGIADAPGPAPASSGRQGLPADSVGILTCTPNDDVCGTSRTSARLTCNDTWQNYANDFFSTTCVGSCHGQSFATVDLVRGRADVIRQKVETGAMPKGATLSEAERRRLLIWLACGAP